MSEFDPNCVHCVVAQWYRARGGIEDNGAAKQAIGLLCQSIGDIIDTFPGQRDELVTFVFRALAHIVGAEMHVVNKERVN